MYICICNKVTDKQIRNAVEDGASTLDHLRDGLNVASCCGRCEECANKVLCESIADQWHSEPQLAIS